MLLVVYFGGVNEGGGGGVSVDVVMVDVFVYDLCFTEIEHGRVLDLL